MATITTTKPRHRKGLVTGLVALALALLTAGVLWLVVSAISDSSTEPAPAERPTAQPYEIPKRAANPNGPGALVSEHAEEWVTDEDRSVVMPDCSRGPASEQSVDAACELRAIP